MDEYEIEYDSYVRRLEREFTGGSWVCLLPGIGIGVFETYAYPEYPPPQTGAGDTKRGQGLEEQITTLPSLASPCRIRRRHQL